HARTAVSLDVVADDPELGEAAGERPGELGLLPVVVDHRQDLPVDEAAGPDEHVPLLVGELLPHQEVVGGERLTEVLVGHCGCRHPDPPQIILIGLSHATRSRIALAGTTPCDVRDGSARAAAASAL